VREETPRVRTLVLDVDDWPRHRAGQHVDIRLTAEEGYQAERSYSIASAPGDRLELTVELVEDGEVSQYLVEEVQPGDAFEVRGPIGGYFAGVEVDGGCVGMLGADVRDDASGARERLDAAVDVVRVDDQEAAHPPHPTPRM
jgi:ferredoxin-NADP reductase